MTEDFYTKLVAGVEKRIGTEPWFTGARIQPESLFDGYTLDEAIDIVTSRTIYLDSPYLGKPDLDPGLTA